MTILLLAECNTTGEEAVVELVWDQALADRIEVAWGRLSEWADLTQGHHSGVQLSHWHDVQAWSLEGDIKSMIYDQPSTRDSWMNNGFALFPDGIENESFVSDYPDSCRIIYMPGCLSMQYFSGREDRLMETWILNRDDMPFQFQGSHATQP